MNTLRKIISIVWALIVVVLAYCMIAVPEFGHVVIVFVIAFGLIVKGVKYLVFYFKIAKHMVGGKAIFYYGVLYLNFEFFTGRLFYFLDVFLMIFLLGFYFFFGFVSIMRAFEMKKMDSHWKLKFCEGLGYVIVAVVGIVFIQSMLMASIIYCAGLLYSAVMGIISSFRQTSIVYIQ